MIEKVPEGTIEFGPEECCAIAHAFAKNKEAVVALKEVVGPAKLKAFADILINTKKMAWAPSAENKIAYEQIIKAELSRLTKGGARLPLRALRRRTHCFPLYGA